MTCLTWMNIRFWRIRSEWFLRSAALSIRATFRIHCPRRLQFINRGFAQDDSEEVCDQIEARVCGDVAAEDSHRKKMEVRAPGRGRPEISDLQCGRRGSRRFHGSRRLRKRPAPAAGGDADRGLCDRRDQSLHLHPRRVPLAIKRSTKHSIRLAPVD